MPHQGLTPELIASLALSLFVVLILIVAVGAALSSILANKWGRIAKLFSKRKTKTPPSE